MLATSSMTVPIGAGAGLREYDIGVNVMTGLMVDKYRESDEERLFLVAVMVTSTSVLAARGA
jgi:hypothetical protein